MSTGGKVVGVIQPNYLPWRGYFDFIHDVDIFVFLDDVQYTRQDWRNRNRVRLLDGRTIWLTVPVLGGINQLINETKIDTRKRWHEAHLATLSQNYRKAPFFPEYSERLSGVLCRGFEGIAELDIALTEEICSWLGITTEFVVSSSLGTSGSKDHKLLQIMKELGATTYVSGPAARAYLQPELWAEAGVELRFKHYPDYPAYPQIAEPFDPAVSIIDLLFMVGPRAPDYIWGSGSA